MDELWSGLLAQIPTFAGLLFVIYAMNNRLDKLQAALLEMLAVELAKEQPTTTNE